MKQFLFVTFFVACSTLTQPVLAFDGGDGSSGNPYLVSTAAHLDNVRNHLEAHFLQTADIDISGYANWVPIGEPLGLGFQGTYDGQGRIISGLTINRPLELCLGLFCLLENPGVIRNTNLTNCTVLGFQAVGTLLGGNYDGTVENCSTAGRVEARDWYVGGLTGVNMDGTIKNSFSSCSVTATNTVIAEPYPEKAGGFVGAVYSSGTITNCYATGNVISENAAGGFVGDAHGDSTITNCYATGNVIAHNKRAGGFVGTAFGNSSIRNCYARGNATAQNNQAGGFCGENASTIEYCYSTGTPSTPGADIGGFCGLDISGTYTACFYDSTLAGYTDSGKGEPLPTSYLKVRTPFLNADWDFIAETTNGTDDFWNIDYCQTLNAGYPYLVMERAHHVITYATDGTVGATLDGPTCQAVLNAGTCAPVIAVAPPSQHFAQWSDGSTNNPRTDTNLASDLDVTAYFEVNEYLLTYIAGANGSITGESHQTVTHGGNGASVEAIPDQGYKFVHWSDGSTTNPRTDTNLASDLTVVANFAEIPMPVTGKTGLLLSIFLLLLLGALALKKAKKA